MAIKDLIIVHFILGLILNSQGLQLSMNRTIGASVCAQLACSNVAQPDGAIFTTTGITIYDVTNTDSKIMLATIAGNDGVLSINPLKANDVTGTGSLTRYQAEVSLTFRNATDCLYGNFQCELKYVNMQGLVDSMFQNTGTGSSSGDGSACCSALTSQLAKLSSRLDNVELEAMGLRLNQSVLEQAVALLRQQNILLETRLLNLSTQVANNNNNNNNNNNVATTTQPAAVASSTQILIPGTGSCDKVTSPNAASAREVFQLWGRVPALCDTETDGGGWVIVQRRTKGDTDFFKLWNSYKVGFGSPYTDYWLGLDVIHNLTAQGYNELRIDMELSGAKYYAHYSIFNVDSEVLSYKLTVSGYSGSAGDSLSYHSGMSFSTSDRDNDKDYFRNCASVFTSAWWYDSCYECNLNGVWGKNTDGGLIWHDIDLHKSLTYTEIKVRIN